MAALSDLSNVGNGVGATVLYIPIGEEGRE